MYPIYQKKITLRKKQKEAEMAKQQVKHITKSKKASFK